MEFWRGTAFRFGDHGGVPFDYAKSMRYFANSCRAAANLEDFLEKSDRCGLARRRRAYLPYIADGASLPFGDL